MDARWPIEIGGIEPIAHLGAGGFGQVWLANQTNLDRKVAVKISHIPFATDDDKRRFDRECRALGQLGGHPHIIEVHTSGESNGLPYLVLQYVDGGTLADHGNALSEAELRRVMDQLCQAVGAAHERGVLHRDLKPENVFLQKDGTVILGDFGIARLGDGNVTDAAGVTGSMAFVAPEVLQGQPPSVQADVYGIAITIISAILGSSPFLSEDSTSIPTIINKVIKAQPPNLAQSGLSPQFQSLLLQTMAPDPTRRPQTVHQLRTQLSQLPPAIGAASLATTPLPPAKTGEGYQRISAPPVQPVSGASLPSQPAPNSVGMPQPTPTPFALTNPGAQPQPSGEDGKKTLAMAALGVGSLLVLAMLFSLIRGPGTETATLGSGTSTPAEQETTTSIDETTTTTEPTTTTTAPPLPLALPLNGPTISRLTEIPLDAGGLDPLLGAADNAEFCNDVPDITGMSDTLAAIYPADATTDNSLRQVAQRLHRFSTPEQASNFIATYTKLSCETWESDDIVSSGVSELEATLHPTEIVYGDETVAVDLVVNLPRSSGFEIKLYSRTTLVRSESDVYKLFYTSTDRKDVDRGVGALLPNAVDRLGY